MCGLLFEILPHHVWAHAFVHIPEASQDFVHRDLKPDNFLVGAGRNCNTVPQLMSQTVCRCLSARAIPMQVHIIDFGLAKRYRNSKRQHIPFSRPAAPLDAGAVSDETGAPAAALVWHAVTIKASEKA